MNEPEERVIETWRPVWEAIEAARLANRARLDEMGRALDRIARIDTRPPCCGWWIVPNGWTLMPQPMPEGHPDAGTHNPELDGDGS